nr:glycoprotein L [Bovine gammaherpesvirus 4]
MRDIYVFCLFMILLFICPFGITLDFLPNPCCAQSKNSTQNITSVFNLSDIYLTTARSNCRGVCICQLHMKKNKPNATMTQKETFCANGFNVMSFFVGLIKLMGNDTSQEDVKLLDHLQKNIASFFSNFTIETTNSSGLSRSLLG